MSSDKHPHKRMGMIMLVMAVALGMLTFYFQGALDRQYNPNQSPDSRITGTNTRTTVEIELLRNRQGHYVTSGSINGKTATFLLDTGATTVAIPLGKADFFNLAKGHTQYTSTANGVTTGYHTTIRELSIGDITLYNVRAILIPNLDDILLGMSALKQLEFTQRGETLTIRQIR